MSKIFKNLDQYVKIQKGNYGSPPQKTYAYMELKKEIVELRMQNDKLKKDLSDLKKSSSETNLAELREENKRLLETLVKQKSICDQQQKKIKL